MPRDFYSPCSKFTILNEREFLNERKIVVAFAKKRSLRVRLDAIRTDRGGTILPRVSRSVWQSTNQRRQADEQPLTTVNDLQWNNERRRGTLLPSRLLQISSSPREPSNPLVSVANPLVSCASTTNSVAVWRSLFARRDDYETTAFARVCTRLIRIRISTVKIEFWKPRG